MRYFGSFGSYALFLYKSKWLSLVTQRGLSPAEERGRCVTRLHIDREGDYCVCETNTA